LSETLTWTGDGLLNTHTVVRNDTGQFTDSRAYFYAAASRRLTEERLNLDGSTRWTNTFTYDTGATAGLGVLTKAGAQNSSSAVWSGLSDAFSRVSSETNTVIHRSAYGRVNGPATITALLDNQPMPVTLDSTGDHNWTNRWNTSLELTPGVHQLSVSAAHPSGQFTTNASVWFTNAASSEIATKTFDAAGNVTQVIWKSNSGATNRTQTLYWNARGWLAQVSERDPNSSGYDWYAAYDPLGRRIETQTFVVTNGIVTGDLPEKTITSLYDPMAEFLEIGVVVDYADYALKLYGPDLNGRYGGLNGVGGFEAISTDLGLLEPTISDSRGNILALYNPSKGLAWSPSRPTGYGAVPGYRPVPFADGADLAQAAAWRGRSPDITGYVYLGARYYNPESGSFLSCDPLWNALDPNYYTFCGADPINGFDSDGRCGLESELRSLYNEYRANNYIAAQAGAFATGDIDRMIRASAGASIEDFFNDVVAGALKGGYATDAGPGAGLGQAAASFIPIFGQAGAVRDLSASFVNMGNAGWQHWGNWVSVGFNALAVIPGVKALRATANAERGMLTVAEVGPGTGLGPGAMWRGEIPTKYIPGYGWTDAGYARMVRQLQAGESVAVDDLRVAAELRQDAFPDFVRNRYRGPLSEAPDLRGTYDWHDPETMIHPGPHQTPHVQVTLPDGRVVRIEVNR
jgi:RHS repeat-associated protein